MSTKKWRNIKEFFCAVLSVPHAASMSIGDRPDQHNLLFVFEIVVVLGIVLYLNSHVVNDC